MLYDKKLIDDKDVLYLFRKNNHNNYEEAKNSDNKMNYLEWPDAYYEENCYFPHILNE